MSAVPHVATQHRIKLYQLDANGQWDDRGTGHVTAQHADNGVWIVFDGRAGFTVSVSVLSTASIGHVRECTPKYRRISFYLCRHH